jgi:adenylosuccinate lyase
MAPHDPGAYENPLAARYASRAMVRIFSEAFRIGQWRRLWLALAETQRELGLSIPEAALAELRARLDDIPFERAAELERELRHDVMAHIRALAEQCPAAGPVLHLGATSCFVTDNSEIIQMRAGLDLLLRKLRAVIAALAAFARRERDRPTVGFTHFQPAQFTTVGKRAALWLQDFVEDHRELRRVRDGLRLRGAKGTTGTQDSFLKLFDGDEARVLELDRRVAARMGFDQVWPLTGQTYPRKQDSAVLAALSGVAQSAGKFSSDLRLLAHLQEVEEPFEAHQVGSSAMAYKRNPMRAERMAGLARWLITIAQNPPLTASTQWLERSLDDSANRRLALGEGFLAADAILELAGDLARGLVVNAAVIARHVDEQLPFIASEELLMEAVKRGGDRQRLHEAIREAAIEAARDLKQRGGPNTFLERLGRQAEFAPVLAALRHRLDPARFVGRAPGQVEAYLVSEVEPLLAAHPDEPFTGEVRV